MRELPNVWELPGLITKKLGDCLQAILDWMARQTVGAACGYAAFRFIRREAVKRADVRPVRPEVFDTDIR